MYRLLHRLWLSRGRWLTAEALAYQLYGDDLTGGPADASTVMRTLVHRLRRELPQGAIESLYGFGYRLKPNIDTSSSPLLAGFDDAHVVVILARSPEDEAAFLKMRAEDMAHDP